MTKETNDFKQWLNDFHEMIEADSINPPVSVSEQIRKTIHSELNPSAFNVFMKLALTTALAGYLSTSFCPQFGIGTKSGGIMPYIMSISPLLCNFACGLIFVGTGALTATLILNKSELRVLRRTKFLQVSALSALSLGLFVCLGAAQLFALEWLWFLGGISGGIISVYLGSSARDKFTFVFSRQTNRS